MNKLTDAYILENGVRIPCVGFGTFLTPSDDIGYNAVISALKAGYRHIDTAAYYGNEEVVGKAMRESGVPREDIFLTTKIWNANRGYDKVMAAFEESMKKLDVGYIDLLLVHWPANPLQYGDKAESLNADTWRAFEDIYASGRVKAIGVSNFKPNHIDALMKTAKIKPMVNQIEVHPGFAHEESVDYCHEHGIVVEAWSPLGGEGGACLKNETVLASAEKHGKSPAQVIGKWLLQRNILPLLKSVTESRIIENSKLFDFTLSDEEIKAINSIPKGMGSCFDSDLVDF